MVLEKKNLAKKSLLAILLTALSLQVSALTLQDVIRDTLANNPDIQVKRQEMLSREHRVREAKGDYLPKLDFEAGVGREWTNSPSTGNNDVTLTREEMALKLRQLVYDGSAVNSEVDRQKARYKVSIFETLETQERIALRTAQRYIDVLRHAELLKVLKDALDEHQKIYDQTASRRDAGVGSRADVDQIAVRLSLATNNFIAGKNNFLNALSQFQGYVGYIPDATEMETIVGLEEGLPLSLEESLEIAFDKHPTIKKGLAGIEEAEAQHDASKSKHHPTVHLEGQRTWNEDIDGTVGENEDWVLALRLRYNIYNGGKHVAGSKRTADLIQKAKDEHRGAVWETEEGMRLSWYAYEATKQQLEHLQVHVESIEATKAAYQKQYQVGRRTLLDLLNTESELVRAKRTFLNTQYDQMYSQIRVLNSSGQLTEALGL